MNQITYFTRANEAIKGVLKMLNSPSQYSNIDCCQKRTLERSDVPDISFTGLSMLQTKKIYVSEDSCLSRNTCKPTH